MAFKDIEGQDKAIEFFRSCVNKDRLAHAYLFLGPEGVGKTFLAENLAKFLNCENPVKNKALFIDCCDSCISCRKIDDFNHPDVHWTEPGKSARISIDEIRLVQKEVSLKAYEGKYKVFIILKADSMTEEAANSLLKTLEEPSGLTLIILTSANISGLLPTIISRSQIIKFYPLRLERLKEILTHRYRLKANDVHFLSAQAEGRIGRALSLKDSNSLDKKNYLIDRVCQDDRRICSTDIFNIKDKRELAGQISSLSNWFRDIVIFKAGLPASSIINADRIERIKSQAKLFGFRELEQIIARINDAHRLIEQNVNPKIALEVMLLKINPPRKKRQNSVP